MASALADLEEGLQTMLTLKPPGVSGSRIGVITKICVENVQSESIIVQKLFMHFKKAPISHKLGVLYVVDSVTRKWVEQAKSAGQHVDGSASDGTFAAGVHRVTELMPVLMNDMLQLLPEGQKDKISKLLDIWEKGSTFPSTMLESFRQKLKAAPEPTQSTTPEGSPPPGLVAFMGYNTNRPAAPTQPPPPSAQSSNAIIAALANLAKQNNAGSPQPPQPPASVPTAAPAAPQTAPQATSQSALQSASSILANLQNVAARHQQQNQQQVAPPTNYAQPPYSMANYPQPAAAAATPAPMAAQFPFAMPQPPVPPQMPFGMPFPGAAAPQPPAPQAQGIQASQVAQLLKMFTDAGVSADKLPGLLASFNAAQPAPGASATPAAHNPYANATGQGWSGPVQSNDSRDQHRYGEGPRSPGGYGRSRSRSPGRRWDSRGPARGSPRGSRDDYRQSPNRSRQDDRDGRGRGSDYRQRSPVGRNDHSPTPRRNSGDKWVEFDRSLPNGRIKVLSRTLFVGGVAYTERELREVFSKYGQVQTCIVNKEKRHAFVKMISREDAVRAKEAMEANRDGDPQLRTRWGVGFGPRDCSDYQTGISIIPIAKLTEADRKWMLTAEYGGSGGRPIETGLVVEEPDIEIGAGVSSKAISRRMQTDKSGNHGPRSTRRHDDGDDRDDFGRDRRGRDRREDGKASGANAQPLPQQFPFGISTLPNGMPQYPPGFVFPAPGSK
ncbi:unnamed protein product [Colletotrichum noveboracense]|uniref:RNA recognition domain-containing protein n=1 Tax=Colletotrichum noveboracense TaxID=2664923 RepID=A0A9W4WJ73_9PEZI|nr:hypothetical protein K456DRAFT_1719382 [Colletotrichum gloeosporioides 23]KAJ0288262.1 hypothetical protein COL940_002048 [Colletotrichum noveboracense]KAJ0294603.1 hypothetical protein CBS470a_000511 [Colletotrichum nupharicola]KAJ0322678.1 hypothetical protein Brms1b_002058 [Colletotrichum noveboracense]CAI0650805.1 unnamed protein product [Colletotrichum noveboracense]